MITKFNHRVNKNRKSKHAKNNFSNQSQDPNPRMIQETLLKKKLTESFLIDMSINLI